MNVPVEWVFHPELGVFKNEALTERIRTSALACDSPLRPDYDDPIPENEDAGWHFKYTGRLADLDSDHFHPLYPFVRYAEEQGRHGEVRAMIPTQYGARRIVAWYVPRVK